MSSEVPSSKEDIPQEDSNVQEPQGLDQEKKDEDIQAQESINDIEQKFEEVSNEKELKDLGFNQTQSNQLADNEARLEQLEKEHETLKSQYMRIAADFDNFRKRQSRDNDDLRIQLTCNTLTEILPIVDNFERARKQLTPEGEEALALHRSYQGLYKQLVDVLKKLGVAPMRVEGQKFDPNLHEAVLKEPSQEYIEDMVIEELQRGYHLDGKVIRHALVKVSTGPGPNSDKQSQLSQKSNSDTAEPTISNEEDV